MGRERGGLWVWKSRRRVSSSRLSSPIGGHARWSLIRLAGSTQALQGSLPGAGPGRPPPATAPCMRAKLTSAARGPGRPDHPNRPDFGLRADFNELARGEERPQRTRAPSSSVALAPPGSLSPRKTSRPKVGSDPRGSARGR